MKDQPDITVIGEAANGTDAIHLARELRSDVCLVDIRMPGQDGIAVTGALAGPNVAHPLRVIIVTTFDLDEYVHALRAGAVGFILKDAGPTLLIEAVRAAHSGDALISPQITLRLLRLIAPNSTRPPLLTCSLVNESWESPELSPQVAQQRNRCRTVHIPQHGQDPCRSFQNKLAVRNRVQIAARAWGTRIVQWPN